VAAGIIKTCIGELKYEVFGHSGNDNDNIWEWRLALINLNIE